jgi:spore germination protein YaaH
MAYPFATLYTPRAGAISPMGGLPFDVTDAVDRQLSRTTPDKVILGLPNYGYHWPTESKWRHGKTRPKSEWASYGRPGSIGLTAAANLAARYGRRWDPEQLVSWTRWRARACAGCPLTWRQLYYDDTQSMSLKYDFANLRDLRGVGVWQLGTGTDRTDFYSLMRAKFGMAD